MWFLGSFRTRFSFPCELYLANFHQHYVSVVVLPLKGLNWYCLFLKWLQTWRSYYQYFWCQMFCVALQSFSWFLRWCLPILNNIKLSSRLAASNIPWWHLCRIQHELRGRELVRTVNPQLVSAVNVFKRSFWNSESDKNYISSKILSFTMMLLVLSRLSCLKIAEFRLRRSSLKVLFIS